MTKKEKIAALGVAMTRSERDGDENDTFYHFTDEAPKELIDVFLEHYDVKNLDYEIFSQACDIVVEVYQEEEDRQRDNRVNSGRIIDSICERASGSASVYTMTRLGYIDAQNQDEISDNVRQISVDIQDAAAYWYDSEVEQAAILVNDWVNAN